MPNTAETFRALSETNRLSLFELLLERPHRVGELVARLSIPQPLVSRHLRVLKTAGLVTDHRSGRTVTYRIAPAEQAALAHLRQWLDRARRAGAEQHAAVGGPASTGSPPRASSWPESDVAESDADGGAFVVRKTSDAFDSYLL
jgi:DNA-binding transcriptional ArsR family regulator